MGNRARSLWLTLATPAFLLAPAATAVNIEWRTVGNPGNPCENTGVYGCIGNVRYVYDIAKYEVTNAQYADFLNSIAATDTFLVYNALMTSNAAGGITRSGAPGSYTYAAKPGYENHPVNYVSYFSALRFANWLNNGQPIGQQNATTTEGGTYTFLDRTTVGDRNPGATIVLTNENEWYKAAYYNAIVNQFYFNAAGSNSIICSVPTSNPIRANCDNLVPGLVDVGSYPNSFSPYGTFDQGGNVMEWIERLPGFEFDVFLRGGSYFSNSNGLAKFDRDYEGTGNVAGSYLGFRVAEIPEPNPALLMTAGLLGLAYRQRRLRSAA